MFIVKDANDLKDPFLCFCLIRKFMDEIEEDYVDYNDNLVAPWTFAMWMYGRGYIGSEAIEAFAKMDMRFFSLRDIMFDEYVFPNSYGEDGFANAKIYTILAEYLSGLSEFRQKLYDSVNNDSDGLINGEFPKNEDGISLACIIDDDDMSEDPKYLTCKITKSINSYRLSLKNLYNLCIRMTIKEADVLSITEEDDD